MFRTLRRGILAGAAGTTALNTVTYLDMSLRGRPGSSTPEKAVEELAERSGHPVPGEGDEHDNRLQGLGPLAGVATGLGVGVVASMLRPVLVRLPRVVSTALIGAAAMAASTGPLTKLGLTEVRSWSSKDWITDILPHLAYGATTLAVLRMVRVDHHDDSHDGHSKSSSQPA